MITISTVIEEEGIKEYLESRNLLKRYKSSKNKLIFSTRGKGLDFKLREPNTDKVYSFRITQKRRAYGYYKNNIFVVSHISDHQK